MGEEGGGERLGGLLRGICVAVDRVRDRGEFVGLATRYTGDPGDFWGRTGEKQQAPVSLLHSKISVL